MNTAISLRLPESLLKKLEAVAEETERPRSFHLLKAVETYLADYADLQIALDRLRDKQDPAVSGAELRKALGV